VASVATAPLPPTATTAPAVTNGSAKATAAPAPSAKPAEEPASNRQIVRSGWVVQVGAFEDEAEAKERLNSAKTKATSLLGKADSYTEKTKKGDKTYYRARFAVVDRGRAEAVCRYLKRNEISCMAMKI
jgi:D-alanyl-D-alanine carboxypeptidase